MMLFVIGMYGARYSIEVISLLVFIKNTIKREADLLARYEHVFCLVVIPKDPFSFSIQDTLDQGAAF